NDEEDEGNDVNESAGDGQDLGPAFAEVPEGLNGLRACKRCTLVKTFAQFYENGCDNCPFLEMDTSSDRVNDCTSSFFEGWV
ncbi:unnamed protein product, partial [Heterosigma akashiwo]